MKSVYEEYMGSQHIWKSYGNRPLIEGERRLIEDHVIRPSRAGARFRILEGGTGSGRIAFRIREQADVSIDAFDLLPDFIEQAEANRRQNGSDIRFFVANAIDLSTFKNEYYDILVYLQQLVCHIPRQDLTAALSECARVLRPGGTLLLSYAADGNRGLERPLDPLLAAVRFLRREPLTRQERPYLHTNDRNGRRVLNMAYFGARQSVIYWFRDGELDAALAAAGFEVVQRLDARKRIVYLACRKR